MEEEGRPEKTTDIAKLVSESWKQLSPEDREEWELKAEQDRARYEAEKANYKGPWKIPAHNKRSTKDPSAPKRPMSAFLAYSNSRRAKLKRANPKATNADLSKMLSKSWKELPPQERAVYMNEEAELRAKYKTDMAAWRKQAAKAKKAQRVEREENPEPVPPPSDSNAQMQQQQQLMEQMQQQQEHFMGGGAGGPVPGGAGGPGVGGGMVGGDPMAQMGADQQALMIQQHQQQQHQQQREAMMAAGADPSQLGSMGVDPSAAAMHQQNMGAGALFGAGQNPYALQAAGLGGFPGGMGGAAFGLNAASAAANPYLANALANQAAYMQAPGQAGLSALMGQNYLQNPGVMGQMANQGLQQGMNQGLAPGLNQGLNQGLYGQNLGGYGLGYNEGN